MKPSVVAKVAAAIYCTREAADPMIARSAVLNRCHVADAVTLAQAICDEVDTRVRAQVWGAAK